MFLKEVWNQDKCLTIGLVLVLMIYCALHLVKVELFPLYLYPMYSLPLDAKQEHTTYKVYSKDGDLVDFSQMSYRKFVTIQNTIKAFDQACVSKDNTPNIEVIHKFISRLDLHHSFLGENLVNRYTLDLPKVRFQSWIQSTFKLEEGVTIQRCIYTWSKGNCKEDSCTSLDL